MRIRALYSRKNLPRGYLLLSLISGGLVFCVGLACALLPSPLWVILIFAGVCLGLAALFRPGLALLLLFACAGLPSFVVHFPGHNMHLIEPATILLLGSIMLRRPSLRAGLPHLLAFLFLVLAILSFIHVPILAQDQPYGADKRLSVLLILCAAFFAGTWLAHEVRRPIGFLTLVLLVSLPLYGIALAQMFGLELAPPLISAPDQHSQAFQEIQAVQGRLWGPFPWPVNFGMYLINLFAVALACWLGGTHRFHRVFGCTMAIASLLAIMGSGTRSAMIAAGVILVVACLLTRRSVLLGVIALLFALLSANFYQEILALFDHDAASAANRLFIWGEALRLIEDNPLFGVGLQQFPHYYRQLLVASANTLSMLGIHPHEQYLEWALESGILWALCGIGWLVSIVGACWRAYWRVSEPQKCLQFAVLLAVLANLVIGLFDVPLDQLEGATFLFLLAGLALGQANDHLPERSGDASRTGDGVAAFLVPQSIKSFQLGETGSSTRKIRTTHKAGDTTQRTGRTILLQLLSWGIALPLIFPVTALLARYLGPEQYGTYSLTFPFLSFFALLGGTGMDPLLARQLSRQPQTLWGKTLSYAAGTRLILTLLSVCLAVITTWLLPINDELRTLFCFGSVTLFFSFSFNGLRFIYTHGYRVEQRIGALVVLETANRLITAGLIVLVVTWRWPLFWAYLLLVYSDLPLFLLQFWLASKRYTIRLRFSLADLRAWTFASFPLLGHQALTLLGGLLDQSLLLIIAGAGPVGLYALASRVVDPLISIAFAYVNGLYPLLCTSFEEGQARFAVACHHATRLLALAVVPLAVGITTQAELIVSLLGGEHFLPAAVAVQLLIWAMVLTFLNQLAERACTAANQERRIPLVTIVSTSANLLLNLLLIPHWQIIGAGIAGLVSEFCAFSLFLFLLRSNIHLHKTVGMLCLVLLSNLPALAFLGWQRTISPFLMLPLSLLLTIGLYFVTRVLTRDDIAQARKLLFSWHRKKGGTEEPQQNLERPWHLADYPTVIVPIIHP
jgi:O-antigen/teichoic acid export membrane protein/O-antigen ligase